MTIPRLQHASMVIPHRPRFFCHDPAGNRLEFTAIEGDYGEDR